MKFSVIIPSYNGEAYIKRCLNSLLKQTYRNYELIVVDDGSTDNTAKVVNNFLNPKIKYYYQTNGGPSKARNFGVEQAHGDYIVYVDSDDYVNKDLLLNLKNEIDKYPVDIVKYRFTNVDLDGNVLNVPNSHLYHNLKMKDAFMLTIKDDLLDTIWMYAYRTKFYKENQFKFKEGYLHEDFGLIPYILVKAKTLSSIDCIGYNYVNDRHGSIMNKGSLAKETKKAYDMLYQADELKAKISKDKTIDDSIKPTFLSFLANACLSRVKIIPQAAKKAYVLELKKRHIADDLLADTFKRKLKKAYYKCLYWGGKKE